ncbi:MAG: ABC transporter ATP-binding protein [Catonella sp.]|nr:ABC transporter ATP-binding protein [Catonella sp.]MDY6357211.1 ABC transporter ATP-binding protein [Catonella sp.]
MIKTLGAFIGKYKKSSILTPIFAALEVVMEMLIPYLTAFIIDDGIKSGNMGNVVKYGIAMLIIACASLYFGVQSGFFASDASAGFAANLRKGMFDKIQTYSFSNIDKFSTAGLVTRLTTDVTNIQNAYQMIIRICVRAPFTLIAAMIMSFILSPELASIFLIVIIVLAVILFMLIRATMKIFDSVFKKYDALNASVQENVSAIRVVKAYVREDYENEKFGKAAGALYKLFVKAETLIAINNPVMMASIYGSMLLISYVGANLIVAGNLTTGELTSFYTYIMNIMMSLMMISMLFVMITMSVASAKRICEVLNEVPDIAEPENAVNEVKDGSIDFDHVNFAYKKGSGEYVLKDIDLHIKSGETIGIIGGTGSAKSSLVNLISRLYDVSEGSVKVGGVDVRDYDLKLLRDSVSVVLQKNVLFTGTIYDNLRWGNENATDEECENAAKLACADEFIDRFPDGYNTKIERGGANVSGGQKQRLCIARALLKSPKVLIMDDSTSAVDTATDAKIRSAMKTAIPGTTKIIIAQRISSVKDADRIIVMDNGMINGFDTHENLMKNNDIYREVVEMQSEGGGDFDKPGEGGNA